MELVERYLNEVGRQLPRKQRADILSELRSSIEDALDERTQGEAQEADLEALLREMGPPSQVAASYYPEGQYLVGPVWFPFFKMVVTIVIAAVVGAQLLAAGISFTFDFDSLPVLETILQIFSSIPAAVGWVVIIFFILQRLEVRPDEEETEFDPRQLPPLQDKEKVSRTESLVSIVFGVIFLVFFALVAENVFLNGIFPGGLFANPVIAAYLPWISLSILLGLLVDTLLLLRGRWHTSTRIVKIASNAFSLVLLALMINEHIAWLDAAGVGGIFESFFQMPELISGSGQVFTMAAFRLALTIAFVAISIDTVVQLFRLVRSLIRGNQTQVLTIRPGA